MTGDSVLPELLGGSAPEYRGVLPEARTDHPRRQPHQVDPDLTAYPYMAWCMGGHGAQGARNLFSLSPLSLAPLSLASLSRLSLSPLSLASLPLPNKRGFGFGFRLDAFCPRLEQITLDANRIRRESMSLEYEPSSEPLHISAKEVFRTLRQAGVRADSDHPHRHPQPQTLSPEPRVLDPEPQFVGRLW